MIKKDEIRIERGSVPAERKFKARDFERPQRMLGILLWLALLFVLLRVGSR